MFGILDRVFNAFKVAFILSLLAPDLEVPAELYEPPKPEVDLSVLLGAVLSPLGFMFGVLRANSELRLA